MLFCEIFKKPCLTHHGNLNKQRAFANLPSHLIFIYLFNNYLFSYKAINTVTYHKDKSGLEELPPDGDGLG